MENDVLVKSISGEDRDLGIGGTRCLFQPKENFVLCVGNILLGFSKSNCDKEERKIKHLWNI